MIWFETLTCQTWMSISAVWKPSRIAGSNPTRMPKAPMRTNRAANAAATFRIGASGQPLGVGESYSPRKYADQASQASTTD